MTREFKFNVWDVENKRMFRNAFKLTNEGTSSWNQFINDSSENLIWLQFTGSKDKNGNEIYEGDIVELSGGFSPKKRPVIFSEYGEWIIGDLGISFGQMKMNGFIDCKVIGHIYQ